MNTNQQTITTMGGLEIGNASHRPAIYADSEIRAMEGKPQIVDQQPSMLLSASLLDKIEMDLDEHDSGVPLQRADAHTIEQYRSALPILLKAYKLAYGLPMRVKAD